LARTFRSGANFRLADTGPDIEYEAVSLIAQDRGVSRGLLYHRRGTKPTVGVHLMHPRTDQSQNYNILPLVQAGYLVLGRAGRWVNNDIATEHERLVFDVAAGVRLLQARGCDSVILLGNSGGGTLAAYYQSQAAASPARRLTQTVAGEPLDLGQADLPPAAGLVLIGAHAGEGASLLKWVDPSIVDENDPYSTNPDLDMYDESNGYRQPPEPTRFEADFLARFRAGQRERVERLDAIARARIDRQNTALAAAAAAEPGPDQVRLEREAAVVHHLQIHRTMADPAFVDLSIEPDDRVVSAYNGDPRPDLVNYGTGVATVLTPAAWLSTWSGVSTHARTDLCLSQVTDPLLVVHYLGDVITRVSEVEGFFEASAASDKQLVKVRHADHYGYRIGSDVTKADRSTEGTGAVVTWMRDRFPV
jgi:pimeloyl-ACP methyl ester carboxylesterase